MPNEMQVYCSIFGQECTADCMKRQDTSANGLLSSFKEDRLGREETTVRGHLLILLFDKTKDYRKGNKK
jgi:hypothetical protein